MRLLLFLSLHYILFAADTGAAGGGAKPDASKLEATPDLLGGKKEAPVRR